MILTQKRELDLSEVAFIKLLFLPVSASRSGCWFQSLGKVLVVAVPSNAEILFFVHLEDFVRDLLALETLTTRFLPSLIAPRTFFLPPDCNLLPARRDTIHVRGSVRGYL
jgi:hypothetical protein